MGEEFDDADRRFAIAFNNEVWDLLAKPRRSAAEDSRMVHAAHASCIHWLSAGTPVHHQRALWLLSRVYAELGNAAEAKRYAAQCAALTERARDLLAPFDLAYAMEALARAHAVAGEVEQALRNRRDAVALAEAVEDEEARALTLDDIRSGNWGALEKEHA
ncbi:MAG: hypothetical protein R3F55_05600 [Alphaproteobacteria bacterium]